jgi:hypothetical protein
VPLDLSISFPNIRIGKKDAAKEAKQAGPGPLRLILDADPEDDEAIVRAGHNLFEVAQRARRPLTDAWAEYYDWARGNQWDGRRPMWRSHAKSNYLFASTFSRASVLTDSRPMLRARARKRTEWKVVQGVVNPLLAYLWEIQNMDSIHMEGVTGGCLFGTYFYKPYWDPTRWDGRGDISTSLVDCRYIFPDPGALAVNGPDSGEFMFHVEPRSIEWTERAFPHLAGKITPDTIPYDFYSTNRAPSRYGQRTPVDQKPWPRGLPIFGPGAKNRGDQGTVMDDIPRVLVYELWIKDDAVDERPEADNPGDQYAERYPTGRRIVWVGGQLATPDRESQRSPYPDARWPFVKVVNYVWPGEYWGGSDIEQAAPVQLERNLAMARIADHMQNFTNGKWVVTKDSGVDTQTLSNSPTQVIQPRRLDQVKRIDGLPLPDGMISYVNILTKDFQTISAYQEVQEGRVPDRIQSGLAIQEVKEAAQTRARITERYIKGALEELCDHWMVLVKKHYPRNRIIRVAEEGSEVPSFIRIKPDEIPMRLDYEVTVGTQLLRGQSKLSTNDSIELYNAGLIDQQAALELIDVPEHKAILQRTNNAKQTILNLMKGDPSFARGVMDILVANQQQGPTGLVRGGTNG